MRNAVTHTATGAVLRYGYCDFTTDGSFDAPTETQVTIDESAVLVSGVPTYYHKVVAGQFVEMDAGEKAVVDAAGIPPVQNDQVLEDFVDANVRVTDSASGVSGKFDLMQIMVNRRELFNDTDSPLYVPGFTPLVGSGGSVTNLNDIHAKHGWHAQEVKKAGYKRPKDLLVYYGWLNSFNSATNFWTNELVAQDMARYSLIVLGDGVQDPAHGDYANTQVIIPRVKALNPSALICGYVTANQTLANFETKAGQWNTLGVHGIFIDEAGYDYGKTRAEFNERVDFVHGQSVANLCFANAWNPDHVLGVVDDPSYPNSTYNASLEQSHLTLDDWCLLESFPVNTTAYGGNAGYESKADWAARGVKAIARRATYGVNLAAVGIIDNASGTGQALFDFLLISALMLSLEACGSSDTAYGASSAAVKRWTRLDPVAQYWSLNPTVQVDVGDADVYWRYAEGGRLKLDHSTGAQVASIESW